MRMGETMSPERLAEIKWLWDSENEGAYTDATPWVVVARQDIPDLLAHIDALTTDLADARAALAASEAEVRRLQAIAQVDHDGATAYLTGEPVEKNPWPEPSENWHLWRTGYWRVHDREFARSLEARRTAGADRGPGDGGDGNP